MFFSVNLTFWVICRQGPCGSEYQISPERSPRLQTDQLFLDSVSETPQLAMAS